MGALQLATPRPPQMMMPASRLPSHPLRSPAATHTACSQRLGCCHKAALASPISPLSTPRQDLDGLRRTAEGVAATLSYHPGDVLLADGGALQLEALTQLKQQLQFENEQLRAEGQMLARVAEQQREREKARRGLPA